MTTTGVIVQSGHNLASGGQLTAALFAHATRLERAVGDNDSKVIMLTEQAARKFDDPLQEFADENGWHLFHPPPRGPRECAILTSRPIKRQTYFLLTEKTLDPKVTRRSAPLFVVAARPQGDDWFGCWHSPAHNDGLDPHNRATKVYLSALNGLKKWRTTVGGEPSIGGDWNADPNRARIFDTLTENFPHMRWAGAADQKPTEGGRVIDGLLTRRRVVRKAETLKKMPGFDHAGVLVVLG